MSSQEAPPSDVGARPGHTKVPTPAQQATYLRRVTRPDLPEPKPTRFQRGMGAFAVVASLSAGVYMVFFMDWHREQHAFTKLRKWAGTDKHEVDLWPMKQGDDWFKQTGFTREELVKMVGEDELQGATIPKAGNAPRRKKFDLDDLRRQQGVGENTNTNSTVPRQSQSSQSSSPSSIMDSVKGTIWTRQREQ